MRGLPQYQGVDAFFDPVQLSWLTVMPLRAVVGGEAWATERWCWVLVRPWTDRVMWRVVLEADMLVVLATTLPEVVQSWVIWIGEYRWAVGYRHCY